MHSSEEMKEEGKVLVASELADLLDCNFFGTPIGLKTGKWLLRVLGVEKINDLASRYNRLIGADFAKSVLMDPLVGVNYEIHGEEFLQRMKDEESFITVSNHPYGGIDGLLLIAIIGTVRQDFKVVVNSVLERIKPLRDNWISVSPSRALEHEPDKNISALIEVGRHVRNGHPVGFFPAGTVAKFSIKGWQPMERTWTSNSARIFQALEVPVYPVAFSGYNSSIFYLLQTIADRFHGLALPAEITNKQGRTVQVYFGEPIHSEELRRCTSDRERADLLHRKTLSLLNTP